MRFAKKFTDAREADGADVTMVSGALGSRALMNIHNNRAGRKAVKASLSRTCKCHGVSGSCTTRTCWRTLPSFTAVGDSLMQRYEYAAQVASAGTEKRAREVLSLTSGHRPPRPLLLTKAVRNVANRGLSSPKPRELVFLDASPNYCERDPRSGSLGTVGRVCNKTSPADSPDDMDRSSCDMMCCGRGYNTHQYLRKWQCECKFIWCCYVQCKTCVELSQYYSCK